MNRKHNPLVSLAALLLLVTILVLACTGCTCDGCYICEAEAAEAPTEDRFTCERVCSTSGPICYIITDTYTGVQYLYCQEHTAAGLCVLQDGEG